MSRIASLPLALLAVLVAVAGPAAASTSHADWPKINGAVKMHTKDQSSAMRGTSKNDKLLGGHGNDTIYGRAGDDVIWGDYKPNGPASRFDHLNGNDGNDFIYASHGRNTIAGGAGNDIVHAHSGHGIIDCGPGIDTLYVSHRSKKSYKISRCETLSFKSDNG
jgi:Ca2+-binding RTX toxin-like protein